MSQQDDSPLVRDIRRAVRAELTTAFVIFTIFIGAGVCIALFLRS